jgi:hypothetical protein
MEPLFKNTAFGRLLTRRNLILVAALVIVADIVLTHYFFNSRYKALFLNRTALAARDATGPVRLGDLTPFEWKRAEIALRDNGGTRFWFTTYETRTYVFDYILEYEPGEIDVDVPSGSLCIPDNEFVLERDEGGVHLRPVRKTAQES